MDKLLVVGSRNFPGSFDEACHIFDNASYIFDCTFETIISGGAISIGGMALRWADSKGYKGEAFYSEYSRYGKAAIFIRNSVMVEACDAAIFVWDGQSKGTKLTLDLMAASGKPYVLVCL